MSVERWMLSTHSRYSIMKNLTGVIFLTLFYNSVLVPSTIGYSHETCKTVGSPSARKRLHSDIDCYLYTPHYIPMNKNRTTVDVFISSNVFVFDEDDDNLEFDGLLYVAWNFENVRWNGTSYDGIESTPIHTRRMWTPDIAFLSPGNDNSEDHGIGDVRCKLSYDGNVECLNFIHRKIRCETDYKLWPYDRPKCTLIITSWSHSFEQVKFDLAYALLHGSNGQWNYWITRIFDDRGLSNYHPDVGSPRIEIDLVLERSNTHIKGRYIVPTIIAMFMTLIALWLDSKSIERLVIACLNIIIHVVCMQDIHGAMPESGTSVPNMIMFYSYSLALATVALVLTCFLRQIKYAKVSTPDWISSRIVRIVNSKVGQLLLIIMFDGNVTIENEIDHDDNADSLTMESKEVIWKYVVIVFNWIVFFVFLFAYVVMYAVLILSSALNTPIDAVDSF